MAEISSEKIAAFTDALNACFRRAGGGKMVADTNCINKIVKENRHTAERYVQIMCVAAASQPSYLQTAAMVAAAYNNEFSATNLLEVVFKKAKELGIEESFNGMIIMPKL